MKSQTTPSSYPPVASGLNLVLPLRKPACGEDKRRQQLALLMAYLEQRRPVTTTALQRLNFVHFARFLPAEDGSTLSVITEFDGPLQSYVMDFIIVLGEEFSRILSYMEGWDGQDGSGNPLVDVRDCPDRYWEYISRHNQVKVAGLPPFDNLHLFRAYPHQTVLDIVGPATGPAPGPVPLRPQLLPEESIDLGDVQANLIRGIGARRALHLALQVGDPAAARQFIGAITGSDRSVPQVSDARPWKQKTESPCRLTVGITHDGLQALGVERDVLARFPAAFRQGPSDWMRAAALGDHGDSGPQHWVLGAPWQVVHLLVSLYGYAGEKAQARFETEARSLRKALDQYALQVVHEQEACVPADGREHFGYRDGISQPRIAGLPGSKPAGKDVQPEARAGEFLLGRGYIGIYGGCSLGTMPEALCTNASFAVVRMLAQDVKAFDDLLVKGADACKKSKEWVAAKLMGRYRDGRPLTQPADGPEPSADHNTFDYAPSGRFPAVENDHRGLVCPAGAHIRRMNPRHARVSGEPHSHRVLRRGMPYGPSRDQDPALEQERGLYGIFVCADIERQFEFLQRVWANGDIAASGIRGTQDPIIGAQDLPGAEGVGCFRIPTKTGELALQVPRLVTTRGSLYLLMPGLTGLKHLATLRSAPTRVSMPARRPAGSSASMSAWISGKVTSSSARLITDSFNPKDPAFLENPYPYYAVFLKKAPVAPVRYGQYRSLWVFGHRLVDDVCNRKDDKGELYFHKPEQPARRILRDFPDPRDEPEARGLFYMNPPLHTEVRRHLQPAVDRHFADAADFARRRARERWARLKLKRGDSFDVVQQFTRPVTRDTLLHGLGIPEADDRWDRFGRIAEGMLQHFDPMQPLQFQAEQIKFSTQLARLLIEASGMCPVHGDKPALWCDLVTKGVRPQGPGLEVPPESPSQTVRGWNNRTILATGANFVLAGFLSMDFLLGNALALLLAESGRGALAYRRADAAGRARILKEVQRYDPPFQLADRVATRDTEVGGVAVDAGTLVTVCYGSANHDPTYFQDPDRFDIGSRQDTAPNWIFGNDHHYCIGAKVADAVTQVILDELLELSPELKLDLNTRPRRTSDAYLRGFNSLTLRT